MDDLKRNSQDDVDLCALLRAQRPPPRWVVFSVLLYPRHSYQLVRAIGEESHRCAVCPLPQAVHTNTNLRQLRLLVLLVNGPLRHLAWLTDNDDELPAAARNWRHTLFNIADAAGARIDGWVAFDGRGGRG